MAARKRGGWGLALLILIVIVVLGWLAWQQWGVHLRGAGGGHVVSMSGDLRAVAPAQDTQLGLQADALSLDRSVEMLQWQETCASDVCRYVLAWSDKPIDSSAFRRPDGHANPRMPFTSHRFVSRDIRLGEQRVDPVLALAGAASQPWPVDVRQLRPNLLATFRVENGTLLAGIDPRQPRAGDLRISYRVVSGGERTLSGVVEGDMLRRAPR